MERATRELGEFHAADEVEACGSAPHLEGIRDLDGFEAYKAAAYALLRVGPGSRLAEIGCGTGDDAARLAALVGPDGSVTGYDASQAMVAVAGRRHADVPGLSFAAALEHSVPVEDETLDAIRCDRVLIHVPNPAACLAEMARCVRIGGRVVVSEPDIPGTWIAAYDNELADIIIARIANTCVSPRLPSDLVGLFRAAGFADPEFLVSPAPIRSRPIIEHLFRITAVLDDLVASGAVEPGRAVRFSADQAAREASGSYLCFGAVVTVSATKRHNGPFKTIKDLSCLRPMKMMAKWRRRRWRGGPPSLSSPAFGYR